jgi:hypothetical protein
VESLISLLYVVPLALIGLVVATEGRRPRWLIAVTLVALPLFYVGHYLLLQGIQGWPTEAPLPERFELVAFDVSEPRPMTGQRGDILLWVRTTQAQQPRVHRLDYSRDLHQSLLAAAERQSEGKTQVGERSVRHAGTPGESGDRLPADSITFRDQVSPRLPAKEAGG